MFLDRIPFESFTLKDVSVNQLNGRKHPSYLD